MKKFIKIWIILFFLGCTGCAPVVLVAAGAGAGIFGMKYQEGQAIAIYKTPLISTWDAVEKVLQTMQIQGLTKEHDDTSGDFKGQLADGRPLRIHLEYKNAEETEVRIRVDTFGDEKISQEIQEKIRQELFGAS